MLFISISAAQTLFLRLGQDHGVQTHFIKDKKALICITGWDVSLVYVKLTTSVSSLWLSPAVQYTMWLPAEEQNAASECKSGLD